MIVKTRIFELYNSDDNGYENLSALAKAMGISVSQIYRVREGKRQINQKFIVGAIKAFPNYRLDDLFYLVPQLPAVNNNPHSRHSAPLTGEPATKEGKITKAHRQRRGGLPQPQRNMDSTLRATLVPS